METFLIVTGMLAVFLTFVGIAAPKRMQREVDLSQASYAHLRARSIGNSRMLRGVADTSVRRALRKDGVNARYLSQLKQANWYWEPGRTRDAQP